MRDRIRQYQSLIIITAGMLALYLIFKLKVFLVIALVLCLIGAFSGYLTAIVANAWLAFAGVLGRINNTIILSLVFYFIVTPLALLMRLFRKRPLRLTRTGGTSYFDIRDHAFTKNDLEEMW